MGAFFWPMIPTSASRSPSCCNVTGAAPSREKKRRATSDGNGRHRGEPGEGKPKHDYSQHAWGAQFVEVSIDERTREIRVTKLVGAFAAGKIINPKTARSQLLGGMVWGMGMGLFEQTVYDARTGKIVNDNLADYLVPVNADVPWIQVLTVEEDDTHVNPLGAKGVGELGITGLAAAIANAIYNATGKRFA